MRKDKQHSEQRSLLIKAAIITAFVLLMLIPISWLKSMINDRKDVTEHMIKEVGKQWGENQIVRGPILVLPIKGQSSQLNSYVYFLPEELDIKGNIDPAQVSKGMVDAMCYQSKLNMTGSFKFPDISKLNLSENEVLWDKAFFMFSLSSLNGVRNKVDFTVNNKDLSLASSTNAAFSGLVVNYPINIEDVQSTYKFNLDLDLNGMDSFLVLPIGRHTTIELKSTGGAVDFVGDFLPNTKSGFPAKWEILDYNRNFPQMWLNNNVQQYDKEAVGVKFVVPVSNYQKLLRSVKYAVLFIVLTFTIFFLIEILTKKRIHPVQYLLVSFALVMFYTLLLAFSEHIGYDIAYLIASIAVIIMITAYTKSVLKNKKQVLVITAFLVSLYTYLYIVVQSESMSLLLGSVGLFIILGIVMYVSRNIDWYAIKEPKKNNENKYSNQHNAESTGIDYFNVDTEKNDSIYDNSKDE